MLFKLQIKKAINQDGLLAKWSNTYYCETLSLTTALVVGANIWASGERLFHRSQVFCYEIYAASAAPGDNIYDRYAVVEADQRGQLAGAGEALPFFNVVRVDLPTLAGGRPSRKFYRPILHEGDQNAGTIVSAALLTALGNGLTYIVGLPEVRDESGNDITGYSVRGITSRRLGREAQLSVPSAPPV